jgi:23S rRNA pseudouridine1911/1915/1917 synthase
VVTEGGRPAVTRYRVLWAGAVVSALSLALETGRTHQIRAHLKHRGHPVFGDPEYGGRGRRAEAVPSAERAAVRAALAGLARQALHAGALAFRHPGGGARMSFRSPLPEDIRRAAAALGAPPDILGPREDS